MAKKDIKFTLDTIDSRYSPVGTVKQLDSVFFHIKITENGVTKDLTGQTIKLFAIKEDKKIVEQTTKINITNQSEGLVEIELLNAAIQVHGFTYFELEISDSNGIISTADFILRVNKRVGSPEAIESTNEVSTLKEIEVYVAQAKQEIKEFKKLKDEMLKTNENININEEARVKAESERVKNDKQRNEVLGEEELITNSNTVIGAINELTKGRMTIGKNMFDKNLAIKGKYIGSNGEINVNSLGFITNYIRVENGTTYRNNWCDKIIGLNNEKKYIKQLCKGSGKFTVDDENIKYILGCGAIDKLSEIMIYKGTNNLPYEEFKTFFEADFAKLAYELREKSLKKEYFNTDIVDENSCSFILKSKNLFDKSKVTKGYYIDPGTGRLIENESFWVSDYIEVSPNTQYTIRYKNQFSEFENKNGVGHDGGGGYSDNINAEPSTFITKENTKFVRFCGHNSQLETNQFEKGSTFTEFEKYEYKIRKDLLPIKEPVIPKRNKTPKEIMARIFDKSINTNIKLVGDSITHGQGGTGFKQDGELIGNFFGHEYRRNLKGHCWANSFRDYLQEKFNCTVINNAVMGTSTVELVNKFDNLISNDDDIVICMYGTNNRINNYGKSSFEPNLQTIIDNCKAKDIDLILMASIPASVDQEENKTETNFHMEDVNHSIAKMCYKNGIEYVNVYQRFLEYCRFTKTPIDNLLIDGLHPNDSGYNVIFDIVCGELGIAIKRDGATW
ncbi:GDSL-type esterase/lipase family protein [Clostridium perfringens]